jgi:transketolase
VLTRQGLPIIDPQLIPDDAIERGAYVLRDAADGAEPRLILIGTGSEVALCLDAAEQLEAGGIPTRVVSMPCVDRFGEQDAAYRDSVLPPACRARVSVEAASTLGWDRWVGDAGEAVGMTGFGASGPGKELFEHFGFTPEKVAETGRRVLGRVDAG